jgi:TP901 family phage tail tape measure protein
MSDAAMNVRLGAKTAEFDAKMAAASKTLKGFGKSMSSVGASMSRSLTLPILAVGAASVKLSLDFQTSMTKIQTLVGHSKEEIAQMKTEVLGMAGQVAKSPVELAEGLYFLESAGLRGANAMETLEQVAKGSASGLGDMESLSVVAAAAQNAYGVETLTASSALDKFGVMVQTGMFKAEELSSVLGKQLGLSSSLGISFDEVGAMIATYTTVTGSATTASDGLGAVMMTFAKLDSEPSKKQSEALEAIGMSAEGVKEMLGEQGLQATMQHLQTAFTANGVPMASFFESSLALKSSLAVLGNQTEAYANNLDALSNSTGFVNEAFEQTAETDAFKMEQAMTNLKVAGTQLGDSLLPIVTALTEKITAFAGWWGKLDKGTKDTIANFLILIAALGPTLFLVGKIAMGVGGLVGFMKKYQVISKIATAAQWLWNAAMTANPIGVIIVAVGALVGAIIYFATATSGVAIKVRNAFKFLVNGVIMYVNLYIGAINSIGKYVGFTIPKIQLLGYETEKAAYTGTEAIEEQTEAIKDLSTAIDDVPDLDVEIDGDGGGGGGGGGKGKTAKIIVGEEEDPVEKAKRMLDIEKQSLVNISNLKKQFLVLDAKNSQEADLIKLEQEKQSALDGVEAVALGAEEKENIEKVYAKKLEILLLKHKEDNQKAADATLSAWEKTFSKLKEGFQNVMKVAGQIFGAIGGLMDAQNEKAETILSNKQAAEQEDYELWLENELMRIEQSSLNDEQKQIKKDKLDLKAADKKKVLDEKQDAETAKMQKKAAKRDKGMKIMSAIMGTAQAVVTALGSTIPPLNFVLAGIVGGLGAAQIATIASTPIPAMADGGLAFGPTLAQVGEYKGASANPEVIAPLDKLKSILGSGGNMNVNVIGSLRGDSIVLSSNKTNINRSRYI